MAFVKKVATDYKADSKAEQIGSDPRTEAVRMYIDERQSQKVVGKRFGVSAVTVGNWVLKAGHKLRTQSEAAGFSRLQLSEFSRLHGEGLSCAEIERLLGVGGVAQAIRRAGGSVRPQPEAIRLARGVTPEKVKKGILLYQSGLKAATVAKRLGVHPTTIFGWLKSEGVHARDRWALRSDKTPEKLIQKWVAMYKGGVSASRIACKFKTHTCVVTRNLRKRGVSVKKTRAIDSELIPKMIKLRKAGLSLEEVGKRVGLSKPTVAKYVRDV